MPKIYPGQGTNSKHNGESKPRKTVGVYDKPEHVGVSREIIIAIAVILAIIAIFLFFRLAWGESESIVQEQVCTYTHVALGHVISCVQKLESNVP